MRRAGLLGTRASPRAKRSRLVLVDIVPMFTVIVFVIGVMVAGYATPTEAAALGCLSVMVLAPCYGA